MIRKILIHEGLESECDGKAEHRFQNTFASKEADLESDFPTHFLKYLPVYIQERETKRHSEFKVMPGNSARDKLCWLSHIILCLSLSFCEMGLCILSHMVVFRDN